MSCESLQHVLHSHEVLHDTCFVCPDCTVPPWEDWRPTDLPQCQEYARSMGSGCQRAASNCRTAHQHGSIPVLPAFDPYFCCRNVKVCCRQSCSRSLQTCGTSRKQGFRASKSNALPILTMMCLMGCILSNSYCNLSNSHCNMSALFVAGSGATL